MNDVTQLHEISAMEALATRKIPDALHGIQLRAISGEEVEGEIFEALLPPLRVKPGKVKSCVVRNHHHASTGAGAGGPKMFEESPAGESVEFIRLASKEEFAISQANRAEIAYAAPRRMM